jgi:flagellar M-ring protein FliF
MSDAAAGRKGLFALTGARRFIALGAAAGVIAIIALVGTWAAAPTYVTLYHDLDLREAGEVGDQLAKSGITHRLSGGGTEIQVPIADIASARVALAKAGLPSSGRPGLELFDKPTWGMTDFTQRVTYQRALEGELARTIGGLQGLERAQVHLVLPTTNALRRLERPAGASVVVTLKSGVALTPETVQGIVYIVSNSVEQLSPDNVAVMDDAGRMLSVPASAGSGGGAANRQLDVTRTYEQQLSAKIEELLETVVGMGRVRAQVAAEMSFDQLDRTVESYDPDGQVLQNEQRSEGGEPPGASSQTIVNNSYQNSHKLERSVGAVGKVTRLSIAVLVDEKSIGRGSGANGKDVKLADLESMVRDAAGVDSARGDRMSVHSVAFEPATPPAGTDTKTRAPGPDLVVVAERASRPLVAIVAIVALLLVAFRALRSGTGTAAAPGAPAPATDASPTNGLAPANGTEAAMLRRRLLADSGGPEATAQVLRAWLADSK